MPDYDEKEDLVDRLVALGRRKKGLSLDQLHRELPENMLDPAELEDVLERLEGANISVAETDAQILERASSLALDDAEQEEEADDDDLDLDLSAGILDKSNDPVRLYLREMGVVPLLNREGEVAIAKRIERGQIKTHKAIARSPIAIERLLLLGEDLQAHRASIRETVVFSEQAEVNLAEDKAEEYMRWTLEGIENIRNSFGELVKEWVKLQKEQEKAVPDKKIKCLKLTENSRQKLIAAIRTVDEEIRRSEGVVRRLKAKLEKKPSPADRKPINAKIKE